jgi:hypothetical protein
MRHTSFRRAFAATLAASFTVVACGWDPSRPFEREAPEVNEAIGHLDAGDASRVAVDILAHYLATGACEEGNIGTPDRLGERPNGTFDLGLALFQLAETFGHRFGDEENDAGFLDPNLKGMRAGQVECALRVVRAVATNPDQPIDLRARAHYLEGNLLFLNASYEEAVRAYDRALELAPGMEDGGPLGRGDGGRPYAVDPVGRDAAWNRAIAMRRIEDQKDAGQDGGGDGGGDSGDGDGGGDAGEGDGGGDAGDGKDGGDDAGGGGDDPPDGGDDAGGDPPPEQDPPEQDDPQDAGAPPPPSRQSQDERILDQLENAPTVQQEAARKQAQKRRVRGMEDK